MTVEAYFLDYGPEGERRFGVRCPTCARELRSPKTKGGELDCPYCGLKMSHLRVFFIPDERGAAWATIYMWTEPSDPPIDRLHWKPLAILTATEFAVLREQVMRPLFAAWNARLVDRGEITQVEAEQRLNILLYGTDKAPDSSTPAQDQGAAPKAEG